MFPIQDQISVVTKAHFEAQLAAIATLTNKTFENVEKLVDLHITVFKTSLEESRLAANQFMAAKDPQEFFSLAAALAQPNIEKALSYGRHVSNIASSTQAEFTKAAEAQIAETNRKVTALVKDATKNAPAGSENVIAIVKSAIDNANAGYEQLSKTTKQAVEAIEANLTTATTQFAQAAEKVVNAKK